MSLKKLLTCPSLEFDAIYEDATIEIINHWS